MLGLGLVQGMVNGVRGLCNGLGPALFGFTFYLFNVDLGYTLLVPAQTINLNKTVTNINTRYSYSPMSSRDIPGPPFLFGAFLATIGLMFALLLPNSKSESNGTVDDQKSIEQTVRLLEIGDDSTNNVQIN